LSIHPVTLQRQSKVSPSDEDRLQVMREKAVLYNMVDSIVRSPPVVRHVPHFKKRVLCACVLLYDILLLPALLVTFTVADCGMATAGMLAPSGVLPLRRAAQGALGSKSHRLFWWLWPL